MSDSRMPVREDGAERTPLDYRQGWGGGSAQEILAGAVQHVGEIGGERESEMPVTVMLTQSEAQVAKLIGQLRSVSNHGNPDLKRDPNQPGWYIDEQAMGAEMVVAKYLNCCPDLEVGPHRKFDLMLRGHKVEVKHTTLCGGKLLVKESDYGADFYVLVVGAIPSYTIIGFAPWAAVFDARNLWNPGHGECYALAQESLMDIAQLKGGAGYG